MISTPSPDQSATLAELLAASGRKKASAPIRRDFVQRGTQTKPVPGPLQLMVQRHDETALDLYLLFMALASGEPWDVTRDARIWGRAIGHGQDADGGASIVSKAWRRLDETYHLVQRERSGRLSRVTALHEDGQGGEYTYPAEGYLRLSFEYWLADDAWHHTLSLPGKASLLIALSLKPPFKLPTERGPAWYGLSADTLDRGLRELRDRDVLSRTYREVTNWLSPTGKTTEYTFRLKRPFARPSAKPDTTARPHLSVVGE
ncbi:hypothetical protein FOS14_19660 [Skermania sp. ID1734]|uniref:hypothetical protein n=1 Tax=Skermania sp. ID1734 TaxID=2597516 RepID=UPI00118033D1|nr:hypothetical protein [Skermania sp. ID1734]TSD94860.1 hypothetical protein FOS14_19660 [Skermania sp. ID1734]